MICPVKDGRYHCRCAEAAFIRDVLTQRANAKQRPFSFGGAHASRVLVLASRQNNFLSNADRGLRWKVKEKFAMAGTPSPTRETRALPGKMRSIATCFSPISNAHSAGCATSGRVCKISAPLATNRCLTLSIFPLYAHL